MQMVDVLVIGAGQAGLSAAYHLRRRGLTPALAHRVTDAAVAPSVKDIRNAPATPNTQNTQPIQGARHTPTAQHSPSIARAPGAAAAPMHAEPARTFVVLDAEQAPGGAWQHRWESLKMETVNGIYELPGFAVPPADPAASSRDVLPPYFAEYEARFGLDVQRPVRVRAVRHPSATHRPGSPDNRLDPDQGPAGQHLPNQHLADRLIIETDAGTWAARYVINATGTWTRPFWPRFPGQETFRGRQLHVHDYVSADEFAGQRVVIVGAGVSATQLLEEISHVADTFWVTRSEPEWVERFTEPTIIAALAEAEERVRRGLPPQSIVRVTGMHRTPWIERADARGVLVRHPMFTSIEPEGVRMPDGTFERADAILWATGFRAELGHLSPLGLRTPQGGIRVANGRSLDEPRLFVIGYGPSQSTVGANRAGRDAVRAITADLAATDQAASA